MLLVTLFFEFKFDSHRSKPVFMMDVSYYSGLMMLNVLFLCKYKYFDGSIQLTGLVEEVITIIVYFM